MVYTEELGPYLYRWDENCFPLGADSLALGEFCSVRSRGRVLDLGCGAGLLLLLCARRNPGLILSGVEQTPAAARWAMENLKANGLTGEIITGDLRTAELPREVDLVVSNPPWYPAGQAGDSRRVEGCALPELCEAAAMALKHGGRFAMVHRPERLAAIMTALRRVGLEPKRLRLCRGRADKPPFAVLIESVKGGHEGLEILPERMG